MKCSHRGFERDKTNGQYKHKFKRCWLAYVLHTLSWSPWMRFDNGGYASYHGHFLLEVLWSAIGEHRSFRPCSFKFVHLTSHKSESQESEHRRKKSCNAAVIFNLALEAIWVYSCRESPVGDLSYTRIPGDWLHLRKQSVSIKGMAQRWRLQFKWYTRHVTDELPVVSLAVLLSMLSVVWVAPIPRWMYAPLFPWSLGNVGL